MNKVTSLPVDCPCIQKKNFRITVETAEKKKGANPVSVQINCPFRNHSDCAKDITIELPVGYQLKKDGKNYRGGKGF